MALTTRSSLVKFDVACPVFCIWTQALWPVQNLLIFLPASICSVKSRVVFTQEKYLKPFDSLEWPHVASNFSLLYPLWISH